MAWIRWSLLARRQFRLKRQYIERSLSPSVNSFISHWRISSFAAAAANCANVSFSRNRNIIDNELLCRAEESRVISCRWPDTHAMPHSLHASRIAQRLWLLFIKLMWCGRFALVFDQVSFCWSTASSHMPPLGFSDAWRVYGFVYLSAARTQHIRVLYACSSSIYAYSAVFLTNSTDDDDGALMTKVVCASVYSLCRHTSLGNFCEYALPRKVIYLFNFISFECTNANNTHTSLALASRCHCT